MDPAALVDNRRNARRAHRDCDDLGLLGLIADIFVTLRYTPTLP